MTITPSKPNKSLILNALFVLGKCQPHEIKKWLDDNASRPLDPVSFSIDYYNTRKGENLGYKVIGNEPSNIIQVKNEELEKQHAKTMDLRTVMRNLKTLDKQDRLVEHDGKTGTYWLSADIRNEIRYFGSWFGEVAASRLFLSATRYDRIHKQNWSIYGLHIH